MLLLWKNLKKLSNSQFRRIVGIKKSTFIRLVKYLLPRWKALRKTGGPNPRLKLRDQLLLTLSYWRNYGSYLETGAKYGVSESAAYRTCRWIEENLKKADFLHLAGKKSLFKNEPQRQILVIDVTECPIQRPAKGKRGRRRNRQKHFYSGKKKKHTIKEQVIIDRNSKEILSTHMKNGKTHDFKLFKFSKCGIHPNKIIQADSGYQGIQKFHSNSEIPIKKKKKKNLSTSEKVQNKILSSSRVAVENVFCYIKKFKIISQGYRNRRRRFGLRFNLICGLYNMERSE